MRDFVKSFFFFGLAVSIEKIISFFLLPLYTHYFKTYEFGVIDLIQVSISILSIFALLQLETALQRYYYEYEGYEKKKMLSTIIIIIIFLSLLLSGILCLFAKHISLILFDQEQYYRLIQLASLQLTFSNFTMLGFLILRYEKKNMSFLILMSIKVVITLSCTLFFVVSLKKGINGVFYAQFIGLMISSILVFFAVNKFLVFDFSNIICRKSMQYALPQFPARIGSALLSYANRYFMVGYLTVSAIGLFSLSLKLASIIQFLEMSFVMAWAPFMHEQQKNKNHKAVFVQVLLLVASPVFFLVCVISLFSKELVQVISSSNFVDSYKYVGGLSLYFSLFIFKEIVDIGPKFLEKTKYLSYTFVLTLIVNLISLYLLIEPFGLYGVVYSMIITNVFLLSLSWFVSNKIYYIPHRIWMFLIIAFPAFSLSVSLMYSLPTLFIRFLILMAVCIFYSVIFIINIKSFLKQKRESILITEIITK